MKKLSKKMYSNLKNASVLVLIGWSSSISFAQAASATLEASLVQTSQCTLGTPVAGTLKLDSTLKTMSVDTRPYVSASVVGTASVSLGTETWTYTASGSSAATITPTSKTIGLRSAATGATAISSLSSGSTNVYIDASATHATEFLKAGTYKVSVVLTCA